MLVFSNIRHLASDIFFMKEAVEKLVKSLVGNADAVEVSEIEDGRAVRIEVRVGEGDMGRLIGREGRTVKALRSLLFYAGQKHGKRYQLDLVE
jgi:predicted RNA-binding protein YlqC (UPF0109 family)